MNRKRRFGLDGAAAVHEFHVTGPMMRDARDNIAFFAFHTFLVEVHSNEENNRVRAKLYNCRACVCNGNVEIRVAGSSGSPAIRKLMHNVLLGKYKKN